MILWLIHIDPDNNMILKKTRLRTPMTTRVYVNLLEGIIRYDKLMYLARDNPFENLVCLIWLQK